MGVSVDNQLRRMEWLEKQVFPGVIEGRIQQRGGSPGVKGMGGDGMVRHQHGAPVKGRGQRVFQPCSGGTGVGFRIIRAQPTVRRTFADGVIVVHHPVGVEFGKREIASVPEIRPAGGPEKTHAVDDDALVLKNVQPPVAVGGDLCKRPVCGFNLGAVEVVIACDKNDRDGKRIQRPFGGAPFGVDVPGQHNHIGIGREWGERVDFDVKVGQWMDEHGRLGRGFSRRNIGKIGRYGIKGELCTGVYGPCHVFGLAR